MDRDKPSPALDDPLNADHSPGSVNPDGSEAAIPRLGEGGAQPGAGGTAKKPALDEGALADERSKPQPHQQQQAKAQQQQAFDGPGYPTADLDGEAGGVQAPDAADETDDDMDPEASHTIPATAPAEDGTPEEGAVDTSIIGDGHADKAAWNRERIEALQERDGTDATVAAEVVFAGRSPGPATPGSAEEMGYEGGAPNEDADSDLPGLDTGDGRLDELANDEEVREDEILDDAAGTLDDSTARAQRRDDEVDEDLVSDITGDAPDRLTGQDGLPDLPEHRLMPDEGLSAEERLLADDNEDAMFASGEMGDEDDLEMEELNEIDDIAADFEDQRSDMDDAASGNERSSGM